MANPDRRRDMLLFWEGPRARIAWESGNAQLEILKSLLLGFQGGSSLNSLLAIQAYLGGDFPFFRRDRKRRIGEGGKGIYGRLSMRPTVGRRDDLQ